MTKPKKKKVKLTSRARSQLQDAEVMRLRFRELHRLEDETARLREQQRGRR
jgi:hypothetical protein